MRWRNETSSFQPCDGHAGPKTSVENLVTVFHDLICAHKLNVSFGLVLNTYWIGVVGINMTREIELLWSDLNFWILKKASQKP